MQESDNMMKFIEELKPVTEGTKRQEFVKDVESDTTIKVWRELGKKKLQGFRINNGLLTQEREIEWGTFGEVIVVPKSWRNIIKAPEEVTRTVKQLLPH